MATSDQFGMSPAGVISTAGTRSISDGRGARRAFLIGVVAVVGLVDLFHLIQIGDISALALLTVLCALLSWFLWLTQRHGARSVPTAFWPFLIFLAWVISSLLWFRPTMLGLQNVTVWIAFAGVTMLAENVAAGLTVPPTWLGKTLELATWCACGLYIVFMVIDGLGTDIVFHARTFALMVLFGLSWFLAGWRYGVRRSLTYSLLIVALIGLSLSRMALSAAVLQYPLARASIHSRRGWLRLAFAAIMAVLTLFILLYSVKPLRERFYLDDTVSSIDAGEAESYTSGRFRYWVITLASSMDSPWIGQGAGSAAGVLNRLYPWIEHPHDEYLRVLHDYGLVGLALFVVSMGMLLRATCQNWLLAERSRKQQARLHLTAFLVLLALCYTILTENSLVYLFIMAPVGVVVGTSLGLRRASNT
jgi:O-antigen ligase